jgi:5-methylcytosine-specific restriction endonuclease McrA
MATRNYAAATKYENQPEQVKKRIERNQARAAVEKKLGHKLPSNVEVDHKKPLGLGGSNDASNLRAISEHRNTAWRRGQKGYKVKAV